MWFLARLYDAQQALDMGLVNTVVPLERLEEETLVWCVVVVVRSCRDARQVYSSEAVSNKIGCGR